MKFLNSKYISIKWIFNIFIIFTFTASAAQINSVSENTDPVKLYEKFELTINVTANYTNPFDPNDIDLWADESEYIIEYHGELEHMYFTTPSAESFYSDFKKFLFAQGEPIASIGPYAQYKVMELAKGSGVVTLDGQGADEQLAGYYYFFGGYYKELIKRMKIRKGKTKYILREAVKDIVPWKIYKRKDKKGFSTPADEWFRSNDFREYIRDTLSSQLFKERGYFDVNDCEEQYNKHLKKEIDITKDIWKWINIEEWFKNYIDSE